MMITNTASAIRDDTVAKAIQHKFDPDLGVCIHCSRGYYEIAEDGEPCMMAPSVLAIDYLSITRDLVASA